MNLRRRLLLLSLPLALASSACSTPVLTAQHQPHVRYPSAPPPEATETAYTRQLREQLNGSETASPAGETESVDATVRRIYQ